MNLAISEHRPAPDLKPFVHSFWFGQFDLDETPNIRSSVAPNGCIELIVHLSNQHDTLSLDDGAWDTSADLALAGRYTQSCEVQVSNLVDVFGIRLYPDGIRNIFGVLPSEFLSSFTNGITVLGRSLKDFCSRIRDLEERPAQLLLAEEYLRRQMEFNEQSCDYTYQSMKQIRKLAGMNDYQQVSSTMPIGNHRLQREFRHPYGVTVSEYIRPSRRNALQKYVQTGTQAMSPLTYDLEFSDPSHFMREFKDYLEIMPGRFSKQRDQYVANPVLDN
ncbi:DUF6597 domain-containing transcriptional factor [Flavilitoribacter nigricans]|uniref:HTH araC/xylS-type domain-containing protein n=1 Tax=Flavilitoribacter nigricans (strain ATCC 23147 / DSM 23189 / NBRC 102662 / NCIMB 1420 / SS-2) TaxID=1122177 RepID=A0A2D0NDE2_FLAN2|nr:DUF6597 domain-containing transcriptional factor [Flavilitoribacter nigricans]PHN06534.1 hypothetical protein CRP01_09525 [Flavilitoribacter nigricans DSM 23189 = NBRC 102662]